RFARLTGDAELAAGGAAQLLRGLLEVGDERLRPADLGHVGVLGASSRRLGHPDQPCSRTTWNSTANAVSPTRRPFPSSSTTVTSWVSLRWTLDGGRASWSTTKRVSVAVKMSRAARYGESGQPAFFSHSASLRANPVSQPPRLLLPAGTLRCGAARRGPSS